MSSDKHVTKSSTWWGKWVGVGVGIVGVGLAYRNARLTEMESFDFAVKVGMKSLKEGCSFTTMSNKLVSSTIGFVERPPQVYDEMFDFSTKSYASRPFVIWAPSGTGKSEYDVKKLEERGSHFLHLMCKESGGLKQTLVGKALGIHSKQDENAYEICKKALSNLKNDQESPRCLIVVDDPTFKNWEEFQMMHEWNKAGLCDLIVVLSEKRDVRGILKEVHGKQGSILQVEYLPPTKDSFSEEIKKSVEEGGSSFPFEQDDMMKLLDFLDVNFSDYGHGLEYLHGGLSIEDAVLKLTEEFKEVVENTIDDGFDLKDIPEQDFIDNLLVLQTDRKLTKKGDSSKTSYEPRIIITPFRRKEWKLELLLTWIQRRLKRNNSNILIFLLFFFILQIFVHEKTRFTFIFIFFIFLASSAESSRDGTLESK